MSNPLTMTAEDYEHARTLLLRELDAERDAHNETNALLKGEIKAHAKTMERLKLAEAVCEWAEADTWTAGTPAWNALAAWRAGK